jgi:hypothetical protein
MDDAQPQLERGPEVHIYHYPPLVRCTECGGSGHVALLGCARPCAACEGSGQIWPPARHEFTPAPLGHYRCKHSFDDQGRLICVERWFEPVGEEPPQGPSGASGNEADAQ